MREVQKVRSITEWIENDRKKDSILGRVMTALESSIISKDDILGLFVFGTAGRNKSPWSAVAHG